MSNYLLCILQIRLAKVLLFFSMYGKTEFCIFKRGVETYFGGKSVLDF